MEMPSLRLFIAAALMAALTGCPGPMPGNDTGVPPSDSGMPEDDGGPPERIAACVVIEHPCRQTDG